MAEQSLHIVVVVCANGLGHLRRILGILDTWTKKNSNLRIDVLATNKQLQIANEWETYKGLQKKRAHFHEGFMKGSLVWHQQEELYSLESVRSWLGILENFPGIHTADLVLSDNLAHVLTVRPDAVLVGSFLWSDVLEAAFPHSESVQEIVEDARRLLRIHRPYMLCVKDIAMPSLASYTKPVPMPWMSQWEHTPNLLSEPRVGNRPKLAILSGASEAALPITEAFLTQLNPMPCDLYLPERLFSRFPELSKGRVQPFGFTQKDFEACDWILCRPGVGVLTDALSVHVPVVCVYEQENHEMVHNAYRMEKLGCGLDVGDLQSNSLPLEAIFDPDIRMQFARQIRTRSMGGLKAAAKWLNRHIHARLETSNKN